MRRALVAVLALAALALVGCAGDPAIRGEPPRQTPSLAEQQQAPKAQPVAGYRLRISALGVDTDLSPIGLNTDGSLQVPPLDEVQRAGLFTEGPKPGQIGPAVIAGHINGGGQPGVFAQLASLREGDTVDVDTPDGPRRFTVYQVLTAHKREFPQEAVYSDTAGPELRLISCTGRLLGREYEDNQIVFAKLSQ